MAHKAAHGRKRAYKGVQGYTPPQAIVLAVRNSAETAMGPLGKITREFEVTPLDITPQSPSNYSCLCFRSTSHQRLN